MASQNIPVLAHDHILVIGGCGFLGSHVVGALQTHFSHARVSVLSRSPLNLQNGVEYHAGDICSATDIEALLDLIHPNIIINAASTPASAGLKASDATTVGGTRNSLACAVKCPSVKHYIYISSTSIVTGAPFSLITESDATLLKPGSPHHDPYIMAKSTADAMVLAANCPTQLRTAVLRPCGIIGERDAQVVPSLLKALEQGMSRIQLGDGTSKFDFVYAGNVADACVCCIEAMVKEELHEPLQGYEVAGEAFFITNGEPIGFWSFARLVWCFAGDRTPPEKIIVVPMWLAFFLARIAEAVMWVFSVGTKRPEKFNRSQMENCSLDRTFNIGKARQRLHWEPKVGLEEAARRSVNWVQPQRSANKNDHK
ncbi:hypothetical protein EAF04_002824 [Stromatinia cepivora]|nr:hypothetical protein EAF04_002824 [Stromatinia cepivora]